jgi:signal transduction histidine kinase
MLAWWRGSLEGRLILRLSVLLAAAMAAGFLAMVAASYRTAAELSNETLADRFVSEFLRDAAWVFPIFAVLVLAIAAWTVRSGLKPMVAASARAAAIAPGAVDVRLPTEDLPSELLPLVVAVNSALDRLETGFTLQRQFTANAAHELRTPLAVLTAALESLEDSSEVARLRLDAARMNRIVGQLLRVARLDAQPIATLQPIDLRAIASHVVEHLAPWAAGAGRRLAYEAPEAPVQVRGDAEALSDALRNLVENAVGHAPADSEVVVRVTADGRLCVADSGPGVAPQDRERVFERFWRGRARAAGTTIGAGLGLAIVAEIVRAHGGTVSVAEADGGGALFCMAISTLPASGRA